MSRRAWVWTFLIAASVYFGVRGPSRALFWGHRSADLAPPYAAARAWLFGKNPYNAKSLSDVLRGAGRELNAAGEPQSNTSLYPPPTFVALIPLAILPWQIARAFFLVACLILFGLHVRALLRLGKLDARET